MSIFKIHHITRYFYDFPVTESANEIRLYPKNDELQKLKEQNIEITGNPEILTYDDFLGNKVGAFTVPGVHKEMVINSTILVETKEVPKFVCSLSKEKCDEAIRKAKSDFRMYEFLLQEPFHYEEEANLVLNELNITQSHPVDAVKILNEYVYKNFKYNSELTTVNTTTDEVWRLKGGVCQDFANVLVLLLRLYGLPSRYVSGYICPNKSGLRGDGATHAWAEAWIPEYGWIGLDPTNNCTVNDKYVRLCTGRKFSDCTPVKGTYKGNSGQSLEVIVSVGYEDGSVLEDVMRQAVPWQSVAPVEKSTYELDLLLQMQQQQQ